MATNSISDNAFLSSLTKSGQAQSQTQTTQATSLQDQFLTLLVTQMQNQDPLNPLDNAQSPASSRRSAPSPASTSSTPPSPAMHTRWSAPPVAAGERH